MTRGYAYVLQPDHPQANKRGYVRRAHLVLEEALGRPLREGCVTHHINGIKDDDSPENLMELFQWKDELPEGKALASELADVFLYLLQLASLSNIDLERAVLDKLRVNYDRDW